MINPIIDFPLATLPSFSTKMFDLNWPANLAKRALGGPCIPSRLVTITPIESSRGFDAKWDCTRAAAASSGQ
jgi:hypothetical protein